MREGFRDLRDRDIISLSLIAMHLDVVQRSVACSCVHVLDWTIHTV